MPACLVTDSVLTDGVLAGLQFAALLALGLLTGSRLLVLFAGAAGVAALTLLGQAVDLAALEPIDLATRFGGVVAGTLLGLGVAGARRRAKQARRIAEELGTTRLVTLRTDASSGTLARTLATLLLVLCAAIALYVEGEAVPQWRMMVDDWRASPIGEALGLAPASAPAALAAHGGDASSKAGAPGASAPATAADADAPPRAKSASAPPSARPQGDLRHCLERSGPQDVLRCAEQGR